jgi:hypothetical protein
MNGSTYVLPDQILGRCQLSNSASRGLNLEQPPVIALAARAEAIDTLLGAERGAPGIVADQTKLAAAHRTAIV